MKMTRDALLLSLALVTIAAPAVAGGKKVSKPFKVWQTETITIDMRSGPVEDGMGLYFPFVPEQFDSHGTHLGNYVGSGEGRFYVFLWETMAPAAMVVASGKYVAANGDEIYYDFSVEDVEAGVESGGSTITGGTGRFEGATGEFGYVTYTETAEMIDGFLVITRTGFLAGKLDY